MYPHTKTHIFTVLRRPRSRHRNIPNSDVETRAPRVAYAAGLHSGSVPLPFAGPRRRRHSPRREPTPNQAASQVSLPAATRLSHPRASLERVTFTCWSVRAAIRTAVVTALALAHRRSSSGLPFRGGAFVILEDPCECGRVSLLRLCAPTLRCPSKSGHDQSATDGRSNETVLRLGVLRTLLWMLFIISDIL